MFIILTYYRTNYKYSNRLIGGLFLVDKRRKE